MTDVNRRQLLAGGTALGTTAAFANANATSTPEPDLSGKSMLITGSSSGFGRLGAEYYARLGATVFATMRNVPRNEADELRDLAASDNLAIEIIEIDVLSDRQVKDGVNKALKATDGKLDALVNNAAISFSGPVEVQDMDATKLIFDTNVYGCHRMAMAVLPAMRAQGSGVIFPISSQLGRVIIPGIAQYSATKFALEAMSEQLAYELVPHGIDVSIIQPGGYPTKIWENSRQITLPLKERTSTDLREAYPQMVEGMGAPRPNTQTTDPMDVPRAIAEILAMPSGRRPLRRAVHPTYRPQEGINTVSAATQIQFLGQSPYGPWIRDVNECPCPLKLGHVLA